MVMLGLLSRCLAGVTVFLSLQIGGAPRFTVNDGSEKVNLKLGHNMVGGSYCTYCLTRI